MVNKLLQFDFIGYMNGALLGISVVVFTRGNQKSVELTG